MRSRSLENSVMEWAADLNFQVWLCRGLACVTGDRLKGKLEASSPPAIRAFRSP